MATTIDYFDTDPFRIGSVTGSAPAAFAPARAPGGPERGPAPGRGGGHFPARVRRVSMEVIRRRRQGASRRHIQEPRQ
ncbi:hypothetical protein GCM10010507_46810 [Streptomyces cinnamoneus]|uniref:Uncharacterized protein n=1 Tax=Streptomyces cinnamoneus TaxID=53446 RepID=A0A918TVV2_STRCJ|nr:hypothetical protein GCM10010507_46810 [Streptomyces cinnamoneus]